MLRFRAFEDSGEVSDEIEPERGQEEGGAADSGVLRVQAEVLLRCPEEELEDLP